MDSRLQSQLKALLSAYVNQLGWLTQDNDPRAVLQYIEASGLLSLKSIWGNIEGNLSKIRADAAKDGAISRAALDEAEYLLEKLQKKQKDGEVVGSKYKQQLKKILELTERALLFCQTTDYLTVQVYEVYALRSKVLLESGQPKQALLAIKEAVQLKPNCLHYHQTLIEILYNHLKRPEEALKHIRSAIDLADYPRAAEEEEANGISLLSERNFYFPTDFIAQLRALESSILKEGCKGSTEHSKAKSAKASETVTKNFSIDYRCQIQMQQGSKGRQMITVEEIPSGTTIFRENAYSTVILPESVTDVCANCNRNLKTIGRNFLVVPCLNCTEVVYCSAECSQLHQTSGGHQYSCGFLGFFIERSKSTSHVFNMLNRTGVGLVLKAIEESQEWTEGKDQDKGGKTPLYDMLAYSKDTRQRFTVEANKNEALRLQAYQAQMTLYSHYEKYPVDYLSNAIINAIDCAIIAAIAQDFTYEQLSGGEEVTSKSNQLVKLIAHTFVAIRRVLTNCFRWSGHDDSGNVMHVATCYNLIGSMFNHDCEPNAEWGIDNSVIKITTVRDVQPGEELTISYGVTKSDSFAQRQKRLLNGYFFQCKCSLCISDCRKEEGVLKCTACETGPVPGKVNSTSFSAACLTCGQVLEGAPEKLLQLERAIADLEIKTKLMSVLFGNSTSEETAAENLASLGASLKSIAELIYSHSYRLLECFYKASRVLFQQDDLNECVTLGNFVDYWLPEGKTARTSELMVISQSKAEEEEESGGTNTSTLWKVNLNHLLFWCTVYRLWIERTGSTDEGHWCKLLRFNRRLKKLFKSILTVKESRLADLQKARDLSEGGPQKKKKDKVEDDECSIREEIDILKQLMVHKGQQLAQLKEQFAGQIDIGRLEVLSLEA